jgi:hypothetical protein
MASDNGFTMRINLKLVEFGNIHDIAGLEDRWYTESGRAGLVVMLKRATYDVIRGMRSDPDMMHVKSRVRLYQWMEGEESNSKLPKMRDIVDSRRDNF